MSELYIFVAHQLEFISSWGDNLFVLAATVLIILRYLIKHKHFKSAYVMFLTLASYVYSVYLKGIFRRARPEAAELDGFSKFDIFSFPSSHVMVYTVFWGFIVYLTFKFAKEAKVLMNVIRVLGIYFIVTIGYSRVFLGAHHVEDALAGYVFGGFFLALLIWLDKKLDNLFTKN